MGKGWAFPLLQDYHVKVITCQDILDDPGITAREQGNLANITIDDVFLYVPPDYSVERMVSPLLEAGYPAVLGVVAQGMGAPAALYSCVIANRGLCGEAISPS